MSKYDKTVEQVEEAYRTRKIEDLGMLKALWRAGWSLKMIADEFRCTEGRVVEVMKESGIA